MQVAVAVQYRVLVTSAYDAYYRLSDPRGQIQSYVFDVVRSTVPRMELDESFASKADIAAAMGSQLQSVMKDYGYEIMNTLVTDLSPDSKVKASMNQINLEARMKLAQVNAAEAQKAIDIKRAEGRAEAKHLDGVGLARMRGAMIDGFAQSVSTLNVADDDKFSGDATQLLLTTQYLDMLEALGRDDAGGTTKLFLPTAMTAVDDMRSRLTMFSKAFK